MITSSTDAGEDFINAAKNHDPIAHNFLDKDDDWYYNDQDYITNTMLGKLENGPQTLKAYLNREISEKEKAHHIYGKAFHCSILEPDEFDKRFFALDDSKIIKKLLSEGSKKPRATNKYKDWHQEQLSIVGDRSIISVEDYNDMMRMQDAIFDRSQCRDMLSNTKKEVAYKGNIEGINVKCKADVLRPGLFALDLKGIKEAPTPSMVTKLLYSYKWVRQSAFYLDILKVDSFWFLTIEKTYPYTIGLYEVSKERLEQGRDMYMDLLKQYNFHFNENPDAIKQFLYLQLL